MSVSNTIQLLILGAIAITVILTYKNIKQQTEFNRFSLSPWVYMVPTGIIKISDTSFRLSWKVENVGKTPAFNCIFLSEITNNQNFPIETFSLRLKGKAKKTVEKTGFIFPSQKIIAKSREIKSGPDKKTLPNEVHKILKLLIKSDLYLHLYYEYSDSNNNIYAFKSTDFLLIKMACGNNIKYENEAINFSQEKIC